MVCMLLLKKSSRAARNAVLQQPATGGHEI